MIINIFILCINVRKENHLAPLPFFAVLLTLGLACDPGNPGALPKCFNYSLTLGPLNNIVPVPI
jgi:hypothetical protein